MEENKNVGCAQPAGGPIETSEEVTEHTNLTIKKEIKKMIKVGQKAPDFSLPAFYEGKFGSVKLSDYLGKWILLCFYPGDFTFV